MGHLLARISLILLLTAGLPPRPAPAYEAALADSRWESVAGARACHLVHVVPLFGTVILTQYRDLRLTGTVVTHRPPAADRLGRLYRVDPPWKGHRRNPLRPVKAHPGINTATLDAAATRTIIRTLENGDYVALHFPDWAGSPVDASLSPVRFRKALRAHQRCLATLRSSSPDAATAAGSDTGQTAAQHPAINDVPESDANSGHITPVSSAMLPGSPETTIYFAEGSAHVDKTDLDAVQTIAKRLRLGGYWSRIAITGHTDATGSNSFNRVLGLARAIEIRNRLISLGIDGERIEVRTAGEREPAADNDDDYGRASNRRVMISGEY